MKKWYIDDVIEFGNSNFKRGFVLTIKGQRAIVEVPSDVPGDSMNSYEEEILLSDKIFSVKYEDGTPVHVTDGAFVGIPYQKYLIQSGAKTLLSDIKEVVEDGNTDFEYGFDVFLTFLIQSPGTETFQLFTEDYINRDCPVDDECNPSFAYLIGKDFNPDDWIAEEDKKAFMQFAKTPLINK